MALRTSISMVLVLLFVCGCQTRVTNLVLVPRPAPQITQRGPATLHQAVTAGRTLNVGFSVNLNPDCSVRSVPSGRIVAQPVHGMLQFVEKSDYAHYLPSNIHAVCNKTRVTGLALAYTPNPDFAGNDFISFEIMTDDGSDVIYNDVITVKPSSPPADDTMSEPSM